MFAVNIEKGGGEPVHVIDTITYSEANLICSALNKVRDDAFNCPQCAERLRTVKNSKPRECPTCKTLIDMPTGSVLTRGCKAVVYKDGERYKRDKD